jgi:hypothetical protein
MWHFRSLSESLTCESDGEWVIIFEDWLKTVTHIDWFIFHIKVLICAFLEKFKNILLYIFEGDQYSVQIMLPINRHFSSLMEESIPLRTQHEHLYSNLNSQSICVCVFLNIHLAMWMWPTAVCQCIYWPLLLAHIHWFEWTSIVCLNSQAGTHMLDNC